MKWVHHPSSYHRRLEVTVRLSTSDPFLHLVHRLTSQLFPTSFRIILPKCDKAKRFKKMRQSAFCNYKKRVALQYPLINTPNYDFRNCEISQETSHFFKALSTGPHSTGRKVIPFTCKNTCRWAKLGFTNFSLICENNRLDISPITNQCCLKGLRLQWITISRAFQPFKFHNLPRPFPRLFSVFHDPKFSLFKIILFFGYFLQYVTCILFCPCFDTSNNLRTTYNTIFHDFPRASIKFHDFPGLETEILKFHDFPLRFSMTRTNPAYLTFSNILQVQRVWQQNFKSITIKTLSYLELQLLLLFSHFCKTEFQVGQFCFNLV